MEPAPVQQSMLVWTFNSLGPAYTLLLPLSALVTCLVVLLLVVRGRGPLASAALVLVVHVPMLIGIFAAIQGAISSYTVIAMSATVVKPSEVAAGISTALVAPMVGMLLMVPSYLIAIVGSLLRSLLSERDLSTGSRPA